MTDKPDERKAVPREATDAMLAAAMRAEKEYGDDYLPYGSAWRVMFDAAPVLATALSGERKALAELVAAEAQLDAALSSDVSAHSCGPAEDRYAAAWANARAVLATAPAEQPTEILNAICQDLLIMAEHRESLETRSVIADCVRRAWDAGHIAGAIQAPASPPEGSDAYTLTADQYDALVRDAMLWRKQSVPSGEVAALIERLRKDVAAMLRGEYDDPERADQVDKAADALARLSAPVPDKEK